MYTYVYIIYIINTFIFFSFFLQQKLDIGNFRRLTPLENVLHDSVITHLRKSLVNFRQLSNLPVVG